MKNGRNHKTTIASVIIALLLISSLQLNAAIGNNKGNNKGGGNNPTPAAGCSPATAIAVLEFNNVRARIEGTGGSMWQDRSNNIAAYNVPKQNSESDPLHTLIYAGALWIGGIDLNGQLKVAAVSFRNIGNDFWPGPLDANAEVTASTCEIFDQYFGISRAMVNAFVAWFADQSAYPDYQIPYAILNYPAKGNTVKKKQQSYYVADHLAPFYDNDGDDFYDPSQGDYPKYDLLGLVDCRTTRDIRLFGDTTLWFVFNDKGNIHSESQGVSIGMEIRGQAFAFATNDEINNMTFYNYELINRSSFTFTGTYFGQWVDADLGNSADDYVGCDASRGLGYAYNGDNNDEDANGVSGFGQTPPAIGVDFFEGPYMDNDNKDNPLTTNIPLAISENGIPYSGLGIGYGDGIIDNERYGMRKFVYYNIGAVINGNGDVRNATDYYSYLQGKWLDGVGRMRWGGDGNPLSTGLGPEADILFPGESDPYFWSTQGVAATPTKWTEVEAGNTPGDRRFIQSAGPFTLLPGAVNDLTVGVVYGRAVSGDNTASLDALRVADDKAQSLFDNCFKILEGPNAPDVTIQELENELILFISNNNQISNNYKEGANLKDPFISIPDTLDGVYQGTDADKDTLKYYKFQGYQIYQVKNASVSVSQLDDPNYSRLVAQVDIEDNISQIVNYTYDESILSNVPKEMVKGNNKGISHSFRVTEDLFATGTNKKLVNHLTYHFIAIAYAYNNWKTVDPQNFSLGGQLKPYLASRTNSTGGSIKTYSGIPHTPKQTNGGTILNSDYGDSPEVTRIEGAGNGGLTLELTYASELQILSSNFMNYPIYQAGLGPIDVKVVDPLNVKKGTYYLQFLDSTSAPILNPIDDAYWRLIEGSDTIYSERAITMRNEQVFADLGFSVTIRQSESPGQETDNKSGFISASVSYSDPTKPWLSGAYDFDSQNDLNWIRSGSQDYDRGNPNPYVSPYNDYFYNGVFFDPNQDFEDILRGTWAPYRLVAHALFRSNGDNVTLPFKDVRNAPGILDHYWVNNTAAKFYSTVDYQYSPSKDPDIDTSVVGIYASHLKNLQSVDIVFTNDKSKWTRCVVFETGFDSTQNEGNARYFAKRKSLNVDKNGVPDGSLNPLGNIGYGMGWFPGYAINIETGERLNMAFGEDSRFINHNGRDMKWNPDGDMFRFDTLNMILDTVHGSRHYTYVFNSRYDQGKYLDSLLSINRNVAPSGIASIQKTCRKTARYIAETAMWCGIPLVAGGQSLLATDARVKLRVKTPYRSFETANSLAPSPSGNSKRPMYMFSMDDFAAESGVNQAAKDMLSKIRAVPNPYYAYSEYESDKFDNRIKITNLPENCTISIYNVSGTLMRRYTKANSLASLDWDLKNHAGIPVAGGVYLIHVEVPDVGEVVLKWFGVTRPTDLNGL
ncbi:MAG: T9SS C-terminal target domain-containing protein [Flavobacteriales bacterium]|nr:T9SS C-terminal target domain-containing protein [Flavobacteriales bacterium]